MKQTMIESLKIENGIKEERFLITRVENVDMEFLNGIRALLNSIYSMKGLDIQCDIVCNNGKAEMQVLVIEEIGELIK